jgi:hypothetical protein
VVAEALTDLPGSQTEIAAASDDADKTGSDLK